MTHAAKSIAILACIVLAASQTFAGAGNRAGTNGASELQIPVGTRAIALGGSTISTSTGVEAIFWNPAGTARMKNSADLYFSHMSYFADIGVNYGAISAGIEGFGVLSLSIKALAIDEIAVTTTRDPDGTGQSFKPQYFTVGVVYARQLSERIAVGLTGNLISERLGDVSATGVSFDIGVLYESLASVNGLSFGIAVKNIGPQMTFSGSGLLQTASVAGQHRPATLYEVQAASFELPSSINFGVGYKRQLNDMFALEGTTTFQSNNFTDDEYRFGLEASYQDLLYLRGGYNFAQRETDAREYLFGPAFGVGIHSALGNTDVAIDYAYRSMKVFEGSHVFSVKLGF
jgi:hypothetical protein